jgi:uncharacterized LabA/DUF88 family protein
MADLVVTYIDGESHYERLLAAWRKLHGDKASLNQLRFKDDPDERLILHLPNAKVFWTRRWSPGQRTIYFTAVSGDLPVVHDARKKIREFDLDPHVVHEKKANAEQRRNLLESAVLIEKPKGVDCAIFVRMMDEAHSGLYQICNLYTSDADYVPVIEAVMNKGKRVIVHGFKQSLGEYSDLEHVAKFMDLEEMLRNDCQCVSKA